MLMDYYYICPNECRMACGDFAVECEDCGEMMVGAELVDGMWIAPGEHPPMDWLVWDLESGDVVCDRCKERVTIHLPVGLRRFGTISAGVVKAHRRCSA
jgi:hypothetical protein